MSKTRHPDCPFSIQNMLQGYETKDRQPGDMANKYFVLKPDMQLFECDVCGSAYYANETPDCRLDKN